ncbi:MAG: DUF4932 domain-containing protein [Planctomycetota bacterium]
MHRTLPLASLLALAVPAIAQTPAAIPVRVDPRIELLSIVFRLAGNPEYSQGKVTSYTKEVDEWFAPVKDHAVVRQAAALRRTRGVSYDAVASFAVHLDGVDPPKLAVPLAPWPERLDTRWTERDAKQFVQNLRSFATSGKVQQFFAAHADFYAAAEQRMQKVVAEHCDLSWFGTFFGEKPTARFQCVLGLLNGGGNFGPSMLGRDGEDLYAIMGCWMVDADGKPDFDATVVPTLVHEYCHSFCNPVVAEHLAALQPHGDALFELFAEPMRAQAYGNGRTLLCESLVRAAVVRYRATVDGAAAAKKEVQEQEQRSFVWTGGLAQLLADEYEQKRAEHPTLHAFGADLAAFFAAEVERQKAERAKSPHVVAMTPANGQRDVDPATKALVVTFDREMMDGMWAVVGGGEHFPKTTGRPSYDAARKVLTVPVELKPDWDYELWLNRGRFDSFRSADGTKLAPVHVTFHTRAK